MKRALRALTVLAAIASAAPIGAALAQPAVNFDKAFAAADANHDGVVTRSEFEHSRQARFHQLDRNHDGYLSEADFPWALAAIGARPAGFSQMLAMFDLDHEGRITLASFISGSMRLFDQADQDHDGVLTKGEAEAEVARLKRQFHASR